MKLAIYEGAKQVKQIKLPGDVTDYDIIIHSSDDTQFPSTKQNDEPPKLPEVPLDAIEKDNNRDTYRRMKESPGSQPAQIREAIYEYQMLTRKQLDLWAEENGYSPRSGGIRSCLIVLENITGEIKRIGPDNDDQRIVWVREN